MHTRREGNGRKEKERGGTERRREFEGDMGEAMRSKRGKEGKKGRGSGVRFHIYEILFKQSSHILSHLADIQGMLCSLTIDYSIYFYRLPSTYPEWKY